jgi:hypothetical protein
LRGVVGPLDPEAAESASDEVDVETDFGAYPTRDKGKARIICLIDHVSRKARAVGGPMSSFAVLNCTICSWTSRKSVVENPEPDSLNTTSETEGGCGAGCEIGDGADGDGEELQPASP